MSDTSDEMESGAACYEGYLEGLRNLQHRIHSNANNGYWETMCGDKIPLEDIEESHRINIIKWCKMKNLIPPKQLGE